MNEPARKPAQDADHVAINVRLAKASDAWLSAQTAVELAEQRLTEAKTEYFAAFQALTDANDARRGEL